MTPPNRPVNAALARLAQLGADPLDDEDARLRKELLVLISVLIMPISLLWGTVYLAFGSPVGFVPFVYFTVSLGAITVFAHTRNAALLLRLQILDILLAPTLSMIPLGGFLGSGGVGLWGILAPLGALVFSDVRAGVRWYVAFLVFFLTSGVVGEAVGGISPGPPGWFTTTMLALNVSVGGTIVFTLLALFAKQRQDALIGLRSEQAKAENLLLNILPRSIADRLKARPETIADQFTAASILFADVVGFTPRSEHLPAAEVVGMLDRALQLLRRSGRALRAREDQDDRRLLHGGRGRSIAAARPRPRSCPHGPGHARGDALEGGGGRLRP